MARDNLTGRRPWWDDFALGVFTATVTFIVAVCALVWIALKLTRLL